MKTQAEPYERLSKDGANKLQLGHLVKTLQPAKKINAAEDLTLAVINSGLWRPSSLFPIPNRNSQVVSATTLWTTAPGGL